MGEFEDEVCERCGTSGYHPKCRAEIAASAEQARLRLLKFTVGGRFGPAPDVTGMSIGEAVARLGQHLGYDPDFDMGSVIENEAWWYIPHRWIGTLGFVVDKPTGQVYELGPGWEDLAQALKAYEQGLITLGARRDTGA